MKLKKLKTGRGAQEWPNGIRCASPKCHRKIAPGDAVLGGRERTQGSIVFHKQCIVSIVCGEWPETRYDEIRRSIIEDPTSVFA